EQTPHIPSSQVPASPENKTLRIGKRIQYRSKSDRTGLIDFQHRLISPWYRFLELTLYWCKLCK
ncbi:MAG: hypothetical protein VXA48_19100, partial [Deltaproteobacteria bacterium]